MSKEFVEIKIKITKCNNGSEYEQTILNKSKKLSKLFKKNLYDDYDIDIDNSNTDGDE